MRNLRSIFASFGAGTALCAAAALAIAVTGAVSSVGGGMSPSRTRAATLEIAPITPQKGFEPAPEARVVVPSPAPDVARAAAPGPSGRRRAAQGTAGATDSGGGRSSRDAEDATGRDGGAAVGETPRARAGDETSQGGGGGASSTLAGVAAAGDSAVRGTTGALADTAGAVAPPAAQPVRDAGSTTADAAGQTSAMVTRTVDAVVEAGATAGRTIDPVAARAAELKAAAPAPDGAPATAARAPVAAP